MSVDILNSDREQLKNVIEKLHIDLLDNKNFEVLPPMCEEYYHLTLNALEQAQHYACLLNYFYMRKM